MNLVAFLLLFAGNWSGAGEGTVGPDNTFVTASCELEIEWRGELRSHRARSLLDECERHGSIATEDSLGRAVEAAIRSLPVLPTTGDGGGLEPEDRK